MNDCLRKQILKGVSELCSLLFYYTANEWTVINSNLYHFQPLKFFGLVYSVLMVDALEKFLSLEARAVWDEIILLSRDWDTKAVRDMT